MIPPKYKFYVAKLDENVELIKGNGISSTGEIISDAIMCSSYILPLDGKKPIYVDLVSSHGYNAIFFYDGSKNFISCITLINHSGFFITPPIRAKYYAVQFTIADANFNAKRGEPFIYLVNDVRPHYKELSKKYSKENNQEFFRTSLDGKINLVGRDFSLVSDSNLESRFMFIIEKYNRLSTKWSIYYRGEFSKTDCSFDSSKKRCELKLTSIDEYSKIMNGYENTYDLIKLAPKITKIDAHKRPLVQVYVQGARTVSNFSGGTYWENEVKEIIDNESDLVNKYHFAYVKTAHEIYISGMLDFNGVYAGVGSAWTSENGHMLFVESGEFSRIYIKHSNGTTYRSVFEYQSPAENFPSGSIEMVDPNGGLNFFISTSNFKYRIYSRMLSDMGTIEDAEGVKTLYNISLDDFAAISQNFKKCIGLTGGTFFCTSAAVDEPTQYGLNDYGQYFTNRFIPNTAGIERPLPICRSSWANASLWFVYDSFYYVWENALKKRYTIKNTYSVADAISALLKQIDPALKHEATPEYSHFLYGGESPILASRFYVYLTQKTNILKGEYDQAAQKAEISFKELSEMLRDCFRCYWYIEGDKLKIEHIWFFINGGNYSPSDANIQLDLTHLTDQFNRMPLSYYQSEIKYDKSGLAQRYEFSWMDSSTELFDGITLDIKSNYVQKGKVEKISPNKFSADVDYMLFYPSAFSNDGFALLCPIKNNGQYELPIVSAILIDEDGNQYTSNSQNWYASWAYLTSTMYIYDAPGQLMHSNVMGEIHTEVKKCMQHSFEFPIEEDLNAQHLVKTDFGNGKIKEYSVDIDTRQAKIELEYNPR